jgi:ACT domain-containing protein
MFVEMVLGLKDVPGMLVRALEPISANGGNIVSVLHSRGKAENVEVHITFKVGDEETLSRIMGALKAERVSVKDVKVEGHKYFRKKSVSLILVGHVIDQDIQDTIDRINKIGLVRDLDVRMSNPGDVSAVLMNVNVDEDRSKRLMDCIADICASKKFLNIREVGL